MVADKAACNRRPNDNWGTDTDDDDNRNFEEIRCFRAGCNIDNSFSK